jgi:DNA-binding response OmpR family regulator
MTVSTAKPKILVIEDHAEILTIMALILKRAGFEVATAQTGRAGIELAQRGEFDLITVDISLPDISGFEVCSRLKQNFRFCGTPVIFVSGRLSEEDRRRAFEAGAADFIFKPFDAHVFASRIFSHLKMVKT